jgi:PAS domain S-box-containing protein
MALTKEAPDLVLGVLRSDDEFILYRGCSPGERSVLALVAAAPVPPAQNIGRLRHEYSLADQLDPAWAARPIELTSRDGRLMLLLEDFGGDPLDQVLDRRRADEFDLATSLRLAISLTRALAGVHGRGLIHKDIKPANALVDDSGRVRLMGFGIASRERRQHHAAKPPELIAGTLPYMAPEQTGRMNRSMDARSDLYSLGVTLYELLTGTLPFMATDAMELIHCHVARQPEPPSERVQGLPAAIDAIVLKLLAKNPEDRYQTAAGTESDLRRCLSAWLKHGRIIAFPLGERDSSDRLLMPETLYGRDAELATLVSAFERVARQGTAELVLVSGYAGIGKSSVVNELRAAVAARSLFAAGKFDQYQRDIPYATLAQALRSLTRQVLGKSEADLARWRDALLSALGPNGQLMVTLVPELALVIGEQPPVPRAEPQDAPARFQAVFEKLLGVFARPEHPLLLFLDDLQWLDSGTLDLLARLVTRREVPYLLLVGAYRDNEVGPAHPLSQTIEALRETGGAVSHIAVAPLDTGHLARLAADVLHTNVERAYPLAELLHEKTGGNPFFAIQFITTLPEEGLLTFDAVRATWGWDVDRIRAKGITDNVAELMAAKLSRLAPATREALEQLACVGTVGRGRTLASLRGTSDAEVLATLGSALTAGLIRLADGSFAFSHDRVQEACYAAMPPPARVSEHLGIGRVLLALTPAAELDQHIFEIVNQLNAGAPAIDTPAERERVAELDLIAGKRAMTSTAYASAQAYFAAGRTLLGEDGWSRGYRLTFELELRRAECEIVRGELTAAEARLTELSLRAADLTDQADVVRLAVLLYFIVGRSERAIEVALDFLARVGIVWTVHPSDAEVRQEYLEMRRRLAGRSPAEIIALPAMTDPVCVATMAVLAELFPNGIVVDRHLGELAIVRMTNLSLEHGHCDNSCVAYSAINMAVASQFDDYSTGYCLGQVACALVDERQADRHKARVQLCFSSMAMAWGEHLPRCRPMLTESIRASSAMGDMAYAAYGLRSLLTVLVMSGVPLPEVEREAEKAVQFASSLQLGVSGDQFIPQLDLVRRLRGASADPDSADDAWAEADVSGQAGLAMAVVFHWVCRLEERVFAHDTAGALEAAGHVEPIRWAMRSLIDEAEYDFYAALARAAACDGATPEQRPVHEIALAAHYARINARAEECPANFANRRALIGAEIARIEGRELEAQTLYEQAVGLARENGFVQNEGLANELAGRLYAKRGLQTVAHAYLRNARACYERWGALGKVRRLEARYPGLRGRSASAFLTTTLDAPLALLDVKTVDKASQTLSREMILPSLLEKLMRLTVEHAGAERGVLVLLHEDELHIEAEATTGVGSIEVAIGRLQVTARDLPLSALQYVLRTRELLVLDDACADGIDSDDEYVRSNRPRSVLCLPILKDTTVVGALYLENNLTTRAFTSDRVAVLDFLASQAAIALENARLYSELQRSEAFLVEGQAISQTGSFQWAPATGRITWSAELFNIFEFAPTTVPTLELAMGRVHPDDLPLVTQQIERAQEGQDFAYEHRLRMRDGRVKHVGLVGHASRDELGNIEFVGAVMDVTERKLAELERERLGQRLREVEKMEAIGRLAGEIAHDFNNVLGGIVAFGEMLFEEAPENTPRRRHAQNVLTAANRGRALVDQILAYSRSQRAKREPISISRAVTETVELVRGSLAADVRLLLDIPAGDLIVTGDATQLHQIVMNVCSNAIHAMPDGGTVQVVLTAEQLDRGRLLSHGKLNAGCYARLAVIDSGCGMEPATLARIFEPFFTTKEVGRGTGLGLALVSAIVVELGGAIDVTSEPRQGSAFAIYLPVAQVTMDRASR